MTPKAPPSIAGSPAEAIAGNHTRNIHPYSCSDPDTQPPYLYPPYAATLLRAPRKPLIVLPQTLSEITGPLFGHETIRDTDNDLTRQHAGAPIGERISVSGRVLDDNGQPVPN